MVCSLDCFRVRCGQSLRIRGRLRKRAMRARRQVSLGSKLRRMSGHCRKCCEAMKPCKGAPRVAKAHNLLEFEQLWSRVVHRAKLIQLSGSCCRCGMPVPKHDIRIFAARVQVTVLPSVVCGYVGSSSNSTSGPSWQNLPTILPTDRPTDQQPPLSAKRRSLNFYIRTTATKPVEQWPAPETLGVLKTNPKPAKAIQRFTSPNSVIVSSIQGESVRISHFAEGVLLQNPPTKSAQKHKTE